MRTSSLVATMAFLLSPVLCATAVTHAQLPDPARIVGSARDDGFEPRWPRRPLLDMATERSGIVALRERDGLYGAGATVCIIDSGIDHRHRDFRDAEDRSRIDWLFDFTAAAPQGVHEELEARFGGAVYTGDELDAAVAPPLDRHGHGTAVASVAVGDDAGPGETNPGPFAGAAPRARLVVVALPFVNGRGFDDEDIARGAEACFGVADAATTVAVLALGGHDGLHDGREPLDVRLDALAATGARIVVAAGNDGRRQIHASGTLAQRATAPVALFVPAPSPPSPSRFVAVAIGSSSAATVALVTPSGTRIGPVGPGERAVGADESGDNRAEIVIDGPEPSGRNRGAIYVVIGGVDGAAFGGEYRLEVTTRGRFDAYVVDHDLGAVLFGPRFEGPFAEPAGTVTVPGTASGVITVGATVGRDLVVTEGGEVRVSGDIGDVASFSARGPTPGAHAKPDLVAPGALVVAALSATVDGDDPLNLFGGVPGELARRRVGSDRVAVTGTSFAAPLVAGALALALGADASRMVDVQSIGRRLLFTARPISSAPWSPESGFGELDALALFHPAPGTSTSAVRADLVTTGPLDAGRPRLTVVGRVSVGGRPYDGPVALFVGRDAGDGEEDELLGTLVARSGVISAATRPPRLYPGDTQTITARVDGVAVGYLEVRARIDAARERNSPMATGGGGCAVGFAAGRVTGRPVAATLVFLAVISLLSGGRRRPRS